MEGGGQKSIELVSLENNDISRSTTTKTIADLHAYNKYLDRNWLLSKNAFSQWLSMFRK